MIIYDKTGAELAEVKEYTYSGVFMGECNVTATLKTDSPIPFDVGDNITFRGEVFTLNNKPTAKKVSKAGTYGEAFQYELLFRSTREDLLNCSFMDHVVDDNLVHYSNFNKQGFYGTVSDLAERLQVNLNRLYTGEKAWTVNVAPEFVSEYKNVKVENVNCWEALSLANSLFGASFTIRGRLITIGATGISVAQVFGQGKGNGILEIERSADAEQQIITRLRPYGSTRNLPSGYNQGTGVYSASSYHPNLMIPNAAVAGIDYIDSVNAAADKYGIREGSVYFDGTNDTVEIYPSIEGMTAEQVNAAGLVVVATGRLDEVVSATAVTTETQEFVEVILKDIGFNINAYLTAETATIYMKSGECSGSELEITTCIKEGDNYKLIVKVSSESDFTVPNIDRNIKAGDRFVLLNITLPDVYVKAAEQRLREAGEKYLAKNDHAVFTYIPKIDNVFMARFPALGQTITEGDVLNFEDTDFGITGAITIQTLTIKFGKEIPEYEITLSESPLVSTIDRIRKDIQNISSGADVNINMYVQLLDSIYIRKDRADIVKGLLSFIKGLKSANFTEGLLGQGFSIQPMRDSSGNILSTWEMVVDYLAVRKRATFTEIIIEQLSHVGGSLLLTPAAAKCTLVEEVEVVFDGTPQPAYRCYFDKEGVENRFVVTDMAVCQKFSPTGGLRYWRYVIGVGTDETKGHYIDLSVTDCEIGSNIPQVGNDIIQFGNRTDAARRSAIVISSYGNSAPCIQMYVDIGLAYEGESSIYTLENREETRIKPNDSVFTGKLVVRGTDGKKYRVPSDKGKWEAGTYYFYDRVSHNGSLWLCLASPSTTLEPSEANAAAWLKQVAKGETGALADYPSHVFIMSDTQPARPVGTEPIPAGWSDAPTSVGIWWMSVATINGATGLAGAWSYPIQVTGSNGSKFPTRFAKNNSLTDYPEIDRTSMNLGVAWTAAPPPIGLGEYLWFTTTEVSTKAALVEGNTFDDTFDDTFYGATGLIAGKVEEMITLWTVPVRISGEAGENGVDGKSVEFIFMRTNSDIPPSPAPESVDEDDYVPVGWTDNPTGADGTSKYEYVCKRVRSTSGHWGEFSAPSLWARYSVDGVDGKDGKDYEYIFIRTVNDSPVSAPTSEQTDDYVPAGWTDNAVGVTASYPYEWISKRTKKDGVWSAFSVPALWAKFGFDGEVGLPAILATLTNDFHSIPCLEDGTGQNYTGANTTIKLFVGGIETTEGVTYTFTAGEGVTVTKSDNVCTVTGLTNDTGYVTCIATLNGKSYTKIFKLVKNRQGITGLEGKSAVNGVLTNDSATLPSNSDGVVSSYTPAAGIFKMYYGLADVTSTSSFTAVATNCTGTINPTTGAYSVTDLPAANATGYLTLTGTYNGVTITRVFSVSKAVAGARGLNPILYEIEPSSLTLKKNVSNVFTPSDVVFKFYYTSGENRNPFTIGYYKTYFSTDGTNYSLLANGQAGTATVTPSASYASIKCELYTDSGFTTLVDTQMVVVVADGSNGTNAINGMLTNDSVTLMANSDGSVIDYTPATGTFKMYFGSADVTNSSTFTATAVNCSGSIGASTGNYLITSFPAANNTAYLTLTGTYNGVTLTRIFSLSKAKTGEAGSPAVTYKIVQSASVLVKNGTTFTPSTITFGFYKTTGSTQTAFTGYGVTSYSTDGSQFYTISGGEGQASGITVTPLSTYKAIKCSLYADSSKTTLLDSQTILIVNDGVAATRYFFIDGLNVVVKKGTAYTPSTLTFYPRMQTGTADPVPATGCKFVLFGYKTESTYDTLISTTTIAAETSFAYNITSNTYIKFLARLLSSTNTVLDEQWVSITEDATSSKDSMAIALGYASYDAMVAYAESSGQKLTINGGYLNATLIETDGLIVKALFAEKVANLAGAIINENVAIFNQAMGIRIPAVISGTNTELNITPTSLPVLSEFISAGSLGGTTNLPAINQSGIKASSGVLSTEGNKMSIATGVISIKFIGLTPSATITVGVRQPTDEGKGCGLSAALYAKFYNSSSVFLTSVYIGTMADWTNTGSSITVSKLIAAKVINVPSGSAYVSLSMVIDGDVFYAVGMTEPTCTITSVSVGAGAYFINATAVYRTQLAPDGIGIALNAINFLHARTDSNKMLLSFMGDIDSNSIAQKLLTMSIAASGLIINVGGYMRKAGFTVGTSVTKVSTGIWKIQHDIYSNYGLGTSSYTIHLTAQNGAYNIPCFMYVSGYDTSTYNWTEVRAMNKDGVLVDTEFYVTFMRI